MDDSARDRSKGLNNTNNQDQSVELKGKALQGAKESVLQDIRRRFTKLVSFGDGKIPLGGAAGTAGKRASGFSAAELFETLRKTQHDTHTANTTRANELVRKKYEEYARSLGLAFPDDITNDEMANMLAEFEEIRRYINNVWHSISGHALGGAEICRSKANELAGAIFGRPGWKMTVLAELRQHGAFRMDAKASPGGGSAYEIVVGLIERERNKDQLPSQLPDKEEPAQSHGQGETP